MLVEARFSSRILQKSVGMYVIIPDGGTPPFATMYLLHGLSDDYSIWQRRTRIEAHVGSLPLMVVLPDGFRGFYTNNAEGPPYADYMAQEIPSLVERNFPARTDRAGRCISGLSMGGYGAFRIALGHPDRFASATSHSGAMLAGSHDWKPRLDQAEFRRIFGASPGGTEHDLFHLVRKAKAARKLPKLRFDCGTDDFLIEDNRKYSAALKTMGVAHEYAEFPGNHNWDYWEVHVRESIAFHAKALGLKPIDANAPAAKKTPQSKR